MSYVIKKSNGLNLTTVEDGTINNSACDIVLVGKNYTGYGQAVNQNLVKMLENFAGPLSPAKPLMGQLWFDTNTRQIKFFDGNVFKSSPTVEVSNSPPSIERAGDLWFDKTNKQLHFYDGEIRTLIGPSAEIENVTESVLVEKVRGTDGFDRFILVYQVKDAADETQSETVAVISQDSFTLSTENPIPGFSSIKKGITLNGANSATGVSSTESPNDFIFWGTSGDSRRLAGLEATAFITKADPTFENKITINNNDALSIQNDRLRFTIAGTAQLPVARISSQTPRIEFFVASGNLLTNAVNIDAGSGIALTPSSSASTDIGRSSTPFNAIYANTIISNGTIQAATFSGNLSGNVAAALITATTSLSVPFINKLGTSGTGNIGQTNNRFGTVFATTINATTNQATYADLAEKYTSDENYAPGTVVKIGGSAEVTLCDRYECEIVAGIVTTNPAYLMNKDLENSVAIALKGRVPCKVKGPVKKGDILVSSNVPGYAEVRRHGHRTNPLAVIGKALEDFNGDLGIIEVMV
jgi:hypothetical protein